MATVAFACTLAVAGCESSESRLKESEALFQRRDQVVELVRSGQLAEPGRMHNQPVNLPAHLADVSHAGMIYVARDPAQEFLMVTFFDRVGVIDQFEGVVYVEDPNHIYPMHDLFASPPKITPIAPNWFHVLVQ